MDQNNNHEDFFYRNSNAESSPAQNYGNGYTQPVQDPDADPFGRQFSGSVDSYAPFTEKKKSNFGTKIFMIAFVTIVFGIFFFPSVLSTISYQIHTLTYDKCTATVTDVTTKSSTYTDAEGDEHKMHDYDVTCKYNYNDADYTSKFKSKNYYRESRKINIYVNPDSPSEMIPKKTLPDLALEIFFDAIFIIVYLIFLAGFWFIDIDSIRKR